MALRSRVIALPIAAALRLYTDSVGTYKVLDIDLPELEGLLPHAESIALEWLLDQCATNEVDWKLHAYVGWDRDHELPPFAAFASDQTAAGPGLATLTAWASSNYRRHARLQLKWRLHTGVTVPKEALFSGVLYVTTKGQ